MAKFYYGGQAVLEGVMMRGQRHMAVAVRAPSGEIVVHEEPLQAAIYKHPAMKWPFLRGLVALWDALGLGMKALMFSANIALEEPGETPAAPAGTEGLPSTSPTQNAVDPRQSPAGSEPSQAFAGPVAWTTIAVALAIMVGIFFVLPVVAAGLISGLTNTHSSLVTNITEGVIRLTLFVGYIWVIGFMPDIKRVFGYHGAEHKTINAYEAGIDLSPKEVQALTLLNPRCGTTFLLIVLVLATIVFVLMGKLPFVLMVASRIVLVPVIAAFSYELIRLMANTYHIALVRAILAPGLALQRLTTRPPDLKMIEVGIAALQAVLVADGVPQTVRAVAIERPVEEGNERAASVA